MEALVLDGHLKSALSTVRSLGRRGISVCSGSDRNTAMALHSRYAKKKFTYTSPKLNQKAFVLDVRNKAYEIKNETGKKPVVYCFSDATHLSIAQAYEELKDVLTFPLPSADSLDIVFDKQKTYEFAQQCEVPIIRTYGASEIDSVHFPAVVKNRHSLVWKNGKSVSGTASFVFDEKKLRHHISELENTTGEFPIVQECIYGDEYGVEMVCENGSVLIEFAHKRIRSLSPTGGAAVVKETALDTRQVNQMRNYARNYVEYLKWTGPIMVEFKIDNRDKSVRLMEINGRFWGSLPLAIEAGADFPMTYLKLAQGKTVENHTDFSPPFIRTRHFLGDVKWLLGVLFAQDSMRSLIYPSRLRAIFDFKIEFFKSKGDIFDITDIMPSVFEYIDILRK